MRTPGYHDVADSLRRLARVLVFPNPNTYPTRFCETTIRVTVARLISANLVRPEACVGYRDGVVLRATVPEATVEKDGDPHSCKYKVSSSAQTFNWPS